METQHWTPDQIIDHVARRHGMVTPVPEHAALSPKFVAECIELVRSEPRPQPRKLEALIEAEVERRLREREALKHLPTVRLDLVLQTPEEVIAFVEAMSPADRAEVSPDWLARARATPAGDPWALGFAVVERGGGAIVGSCGFTGPPDPDGVVVTASTRAAAAAGTPPRRPGR